MRFFLSVTELVFVSSIYSGYFAHKIILVLTFTSVGVSVLQAMSSLPTNGIVRILMNAHSHQVSAQMVCVKT